MEVSSLQASNLPLSAKHISSLTQLSSGQTITAKVIEQYPARSEVILKIGSIITSVKSDIPTSVGETIKAVVQKNNNAITLLVSLPTKEPPPLASRLRQLLPAQRPIQSLYNSLQQINFKAAPVEDKSHNAVSRAKDLPTQLESLSLKILKSTPSVDQLIRPIELKRSLENSGVFLEAALKKTLSEKSSPTTDTKALSKHRIQELLTRMLSENLIKAPISKSAQAPNNPSIPKVDTKADLLRLITLLRQWPTVTSTVPQQLKQAQKGLPTAEFPIADLLAKSEGALAKTTLNQLASSTTDSGNRQTWQFDIPYFNGQNIDTFFLKIEQEDSASKAEKEDNRWSISLEISPPNLGLIKNKLSLINGAINSQFWTESRSISSLIQQHLELLKSQFVEANLEVQSLKVHSGKGPDFKQKIVTDSLLHEEV